MARESGQGKGPEVHLCPFLGGLAPESIEERIAVFCIRFFLTDYSTLAYK